MWKLEWTADFVLFVHVFICLAAHLQLVAPIPTSVEELDSTYGFSMVL